MYPQVSEAEPASKSACAERTGFDDSFAERLCQELTSCGLVDASAIGRARRAIEQTHERLDHAFVRLGIIPETKLVDVMARLANLEVANLEPTRHRHKPDSRYPC